MQKFRLFSKNKQGKEVRRQFVVPPEGIGTAVRDYLTDERADVTPFRLVHVVRRHQYQDIPLPQSA